MIISFLEIILNHNHSIQSLPFEFFKLFRWWRKFKMLAKLICIDSNQTQEKKTFRQTAWQKAFVEFKLKHPFCNTFRHLKSNSVFNLNAKRIKATYRSAIESNNNNFAKFKHAFCGDFIFSCVAVAKESKNANKFTVIEIGNANLNWHSYKSAYVMYFKCIECQYNRMPKLSTIL